MLSTIKTIALNGLEGELIEVQTDITGGLPDFSIVGLPDTSVKESKQRIKTAIKNSGGKLLQSVNVFDVYNGKGIPEGKKSIAFSVELGDSTKTLTDEEINAVMNKVTENLKAKFGAELRK